MPTLAVIVVVADCFAFLICCHLIKTLANLLSNFLLHATREGAPTMKVKIKMIETDSDGGSLKR